MNAPSADARLAARALLLLGLRLSRWSLAGARKLAPWLYELPR